MTNRRPGWPEFCMGLLALSLGGIVGSVAMLGVLGVNGSFALSGTSFALLIAGLVGLVYWALLDALRRPMPPTERFLYLGLIFLMVPVGAILYYGLIYRSDPGLMPPRPPSPRSSPRD